MKNHLLTLCIVLILSKPLLFQTIEETISSAILSGYSNTITPIGEISLDIKFNLKQIVGLDEKNQIMTTNSYITQEWIDSRLAWNASSYSNTEKIMIQATKLWLPELNVLNAADGDGFFKISSQNLAILFYTGKVYFVLSSNNLKTRCKMNVIKFPYDKQTCSIQLGSWTLPTEDININKVDIISKDFIPNSIWDLKNLTYESKISSQRFIGLNDNFELEDIVFNFTLKRRPLYTMVNGVLPGFILNFMTFLLFFLQLNEQLKITLKIILTSSVYSLKLSSDIPVQSDYLTYVTLYFVFSLLYNLISFIWFTISHQMQSKLILPKPVEMFTVFLRKNLIDRKKDKVEPASENKDEDNKKPEPVSVIVCECNKKTKEEEDKEKRKKHVKKCVGILHYIVQILMFMLMFTTNLALWVIISTE